MFKEQNERFYYIHRCAEEHLSVNALKKIIKAEAYQNSKALPNNFQTTITKESVAQRIQRKADSTIPHTDPFKVPYPKFTVNLQ